MTREEMLAICKKAPAIGAIRHEEFVDWIFVYNRKSKGVTVETPYFPVDAKVTMAREDHRRQGKKLDIMPAVVLSDTEDNLTLSVTVLSEIYGQASGLATSRRKAPDYVTNTGEIKPGSEGAEQKFPWEIAETSALGRALSTFGYGVLPGTGLSSAEDIMRADSRGTRTESRPPVAPKDFVLNMKRAKEMTHKSAPTIQDVYDTEDGPDYLQWIADNFSDGEAKTAVTQFLLDPTIGEDEETEDEDDAREEGVKQLAQAIKEADAISKAPIVVVEQPKTVFTPSGWPPTPAVQPAPTVSRTGLTPGLVIESLNAPSGVAPVATDQPKTHWIDVPERRKLFWGEVSKVRINGKVPPQATICEILGVEHVHDYKGSIEQALSTINKYVSGLT